MTSSQSSSKIAAHKEYFALLSKAAARSGSSYGSLEAYWDDVRKNLPTPPKEWSLKPTALEQCLESFNRLSGDDRQKFLEAITNKPLE